MPRKISKKNLKNQEPKPEIKKESNPVKKIIGVKLSCITCKRETSEEVKGPTVIANRLCAYDTSPLSQTFIWT